MATCVHMCVHKCASVCVRMCNCGLNILFKILAKHINTHTLYTHKIALDFSKRYYFSLFLFAGDHMI